jgi:serine/threonine protein kinase
LDDSRLRRDLAREASMLRSLDHPVLPRSFGADVESERPYLVLEYVDGPRLSTVIRGQRFLAVEQAVPLLQQVTAALHYMHANGVVHLDVKPKNVIMSPPPRLIDLSIARTFNEARATPGPIGTDPYMAPEQTGGRGDEMGPATDVWGLGVTLFESLTGSRPFPAGDPSASGAARFPQLRLDPTPVPKGVPDDLAELIRATLERRPADRPSAADVADTLDPVIENAPRKLLLGKFRVSTWKPNRT